MTKQRSEFEPHYCVLEACTWRIVSELMRYDLEKELRIHQFYPGASGHGIIRVRHNTHGSHVSFQLGGGGQGEIIVVKNERKTSQGFVYSMLEEQPCEQIVESIQQELGWPLGKKVKTTPTILVCRLIARFLERYILAPTRFRATSGFFDNSQIGPEFAAWLQLVGFDGPLGDCDSATPEQIKRGKRYWLIHRTHVGGAPLFDLPDTNEPPAVVLDLSTGRAVSTRTPQKVISLFDSYLASGHRLKTVLLQLEGLLEAP